MFKKVLDGMLYGIGLSLGITLLKFMATGLGYLIVMVSLLFSTKMA